MSDNSVIRVLRSIPVLMKSRVKAIFWWTWVLSLNLLIVGGGFPPIRPSLILVFSMIFITSSVYIYNDIVDVEMDQENEVKKNRPIASGLVSKSDAHKIVYLFGLVGLTFAWFVNITSFSFILTFFILFYAYSHPLIRLKIRFLAKDFTMFIGAPLLCLAANYAISNVISTIAITCSVLMAFFLLTLGPVVNDISDIVEDKKYGVKSLSTMLSWENKINLMLFGILLQLVIVPMIQFRFGSNLILPIVSVVMLLMLLRFWYPLLKNYDLNNYNKVRYIGMLYVFTSPITFILISSGMPLFLMHLF
jgi:4-hydroxybenzoate polyprenyltransferase